MTVSEYINHPQAIGKAECATLLGYAHWRNVQQAIEQSAELCEALKQNNYIKTAKLLTPKQGVLIVKHLTR